MATNIQPRPSTIATQPKPSTFVFAVGPSPALLTWTVLRLRIPTKVFSMRFEAARTEHSTQRTGCSTAGTRSRPRRRTAPCTGHRGSGRTVGHIAAGTPHAGRIAERTAAGTERTAPGSSPCPESPRRLAHHHRSWLASGPARRLPAHTTRTHGRRRRKQWGNLGNAGPGKKLDMLGASPKVRWLASGKYIARFASRFHRCLVS
mmetsp:Transcript_27429/g.61980  ORF Transcript_27429/g.61980 Transcript_27429/m.61980 type:complete len:204 (-) Transcript_27429:272-883(-)